MCQLSWRLPLLLVFCAHLGFVSAAQAASGVQNEASASSPKAGQTVDLLLQTLPDAWLYDASGLYLKAKESTSVEELPVRWVSLKELLSAATEQGTKQPKGINLQTGALATSLWPTWDSAVKEWLEMGTGASANSALVKHRKKGLPAPLQKALAEQLQLMAQQKALRDYYAWVKALLQESVAKQQARFEAQKLPTLYYELSQGKDLSLKLLAARSLVLEQQNQVLQAVQIERLSELAIESWLQKSRSQQAETLRPACLQQPEALLLEPKEGGSPELPLPEGFPKSWQQAVQAAKTQRPEWQLMRWLQSPRGGRSPAVSWLLASKRLPPLPLSDLEAQLDSSTEALAKQNWLAAQAAHEQWQLHTAQWQLARVQASQSQACVKAGLCSLKQQEASQFWLALTAFKAQMALADLQLKRLELAAFCGQLQESL